MNRCFCFGRVLSNCRCFNCAGVARLGRDLANLRASQFGNNKLMVMSLVRFMVYMAEGVGNAPTSVMPILFSRQVQPAYICLPSKIGCQSWNRTNTARLNRPACYFDTIWQWRCRQER
jgi:hypothetical protein